MDWDRIEYLKQLTPYELLDAYFVAQQAVFSTVSVFMTILFAYLTVAYFVSSRLSRFQAYTISGLYSFFSFYVIYGAYTTADLLAAIIFATSGQNFGWVATFTPSFLLVCWIFSIVLFVQARKQGDE